MLLERRRKQIEMVYSFVILDTVSAYNALLGRPWIHRMGVISYSIHQLVKFPRHEGIISLRADQLPSHKCQVKGKSINGLFQDIPHITCQISAPSSNSLELDTETTEGVERINVGTEVEPQYL